MIDRVRMCVCFLRIWEEGWENQGLGMRKRTQAKLDTRTWVSTIERSLRIDRSENRLEYPEWVIKPDLTNKIKCPRREESLEDVCGGRSWWKNQNFTKTPRSERDEDLSTRSWRLSGNQVKKFREMLDKVEDPLKKTPLGRFLWE